MDGIIPFALLQQLPGIGLGITDAASGQMIKASGVDADGKPTGWVAVDGVEIVTLRDGTMTLADLAALLADINASGEHVFFDTAALAYPLYLCTIAINYDGATPTSYRLNDLVTGSVSTSYTTGPESKALSNTTVVGVTLGVGEHNAHGIGTNSVQAFDHFASLVDYLHVYVNFQTTTSAVDVRSTGDSYIVLAAFVYSAQTSEVISSLTQSILTTVSSYVVSSYGSLQVVCAHLLVADSGYQSIQAVSLVDEAHLDTLFDYSIDIGQRSVSLNTALA